MVQEALRILITTIISFVVALSLTSFVLDFLRSRGFGKSIRSAEQAPVVNRLHAGKEGTPTMGGVLIWGTVLILALLFFILDLVFEAFPSRLNFIDRAQTYLPLVALILGAGLGLLDDILGVLKRGLFRKVDRGGGLTISQKLLVYTLLSIVGAWWFYSPDNLNWHTIHVPFEGNFDIGIWYVPIFMFVVVATTFSANETDGLDGLLGGVSLFAFGALTVIAFTLGRFDLAAMGGAIVGALLAFLWFNIYPAQFFMGDTGSMSLGVTLAMITMLTNTVFLLPLFAIIMVLESASVVIQVTSKKLFKRKVFLSAPIHHHFEAKGWHESRVTMRFWIISVIFTGLGLVIFFLDRLTSSI